MCTPTPWPKLVMGGVSCPWGMYTCPPTKISWMHTWSHYTYPPGPIPGLRGLHTPPHQNVHGCIPSFTPLLLKEGRDSMLDKHSCLSENCFILQNSTQQSYRIKMYGNDLKIYLQWKCQTSYPSLTESLLWENKILVNLYASFVLVVDAWFSILSFPNQ